MEFNGRVVTEGIGAAIECPMGSPRAAGILTASIEGDRAFKTSMEVKPQDKGRWRDVMQKALARQEARVP